MNRKIKTLIYGSCVSRDVVRLFPERYDLKYYIARQSWVSSNSAPARNPGATPLGEGFQQRSLVGDFLSNANGLVQKYGSESELILVDIASDRRGVYEIGEDQFVSFTGELGRSQLLSKFPNRKFIGFGTSRHFGLFQHAAESLKHSLQSIDSWDSTLILKFKFTDSSDNGSVVPTVLDTQSEQWNVLYARYYAFLEHLGFNFVSLPDDLAISSANHNWGIGQDHFIDEAYEWWNENISIKHGFI